MQVHINYYTVVIAAIIPFALGGLWYSSVLFAKKWIALIRESVDAPRGKHVDAIWHRLDRCCYQQPCLGMHRLPHRNNHHALRCSPRICMLVGIHRSHLINDIAVLPQTIKPLVD
jgi:hypothetical protein